MKLWIARHSHAGDEESDPKKERERGLTSDGKRIARAIANGMLDSDEIPNVIFSSPFQRAIETADILGKTLGIHVNVVGDLAPDRPLEDEILGLMAHGEVKRLMLVGHHDNLSPAMNALGGDVDWDDEVMGEVRRVEIDRKTGEWEMKWTLRPSDVGEKDYE